MIAKRGPRKGNEPYMGSKDFILHHTVNTLEQKGGGVFAITVRK